MKRTKAEIEIWVQNQWKDVKKLTVGKVLTEFNLRGRLVNPGQDILLVKNYIYPLHRLRMVPALVLRIDKKNLKLSELVDLQVREWIEIDIDKIDFSLLRKTEERLSSGQYISEKKLKERQQDQAAKY